MEVGHNWINNWIDAPKFAQDYASGVWRVYEVGEKWKGKCFTFYSRCEIGMGSYNQLCRCSSSIVLQLILHCSISRLARANTLDQLRLAQLTCLTCGSNQEVELSKENNLLPPRLRGRRQGPVPSTELWPTYNIMYDIV